jgi:hypothetical protein
MSHKYQMIQRGEFTHEMRVAAQLLALPKSERPMNKEIAKQAGVSERTLRGWKKEEKFRQLIDQNVKNAVRDKMPDVLQTLVQRAIEGSAKHAELLLKYQGLLKESHQHEIVQVPSRHDLDEFDRFDADLEAEIARLKLEIDEENIVDADFEEVDE